MIFLFHTQAKILGFFLANLPIFAALLQAIIEQFIFLDASILFNKFLGLFIALISFFEGVTHLMFLFLIFYAQAADQLLQIQSLWRHGARTAIYCNWMCNEFKDLLNGYLTPAGMRQQFLLGQWFRQRYIEDLKFLKDTYDVDEIIIYATDVNRTVMSALSNFQGLYPFGKGPTVPVVPEQYLNPPSQIIQPPPEVGDNALPFQIQTIPFHMQENQDDKNLRGYGSPACGSAYIFQAANKITAMSKRVEERAKPLKIKFANMMNLDPQTLDIFKLSNYQDTFTTCVYNNNPIPKGLTNEMYNELDQLNTLTTLISLYRTWDQARLLSQPFMTNLLKNFDEVGSTTYKFHAYSAHDVTVQLIMIAMNFTSSDCVEQVWNGSKVDNKNCIYSFPGYASNLIWELWEDSNKEKYIKVLYNGTYQNICDGLSDKCSYKKFKEIVLQQNLDFDEGCKLPFQGKTVIQVPTWLTTVTYLVLALVLIVVGYGIFLLGGLVKKSRKRQLLGGGSVQQSR
ncbi:hypothetical protein pb186bvf_013936 [Paramecium bursaria]